MALGNEDFEKHVLARKAKPPAILYKYATVETARSILSSGKLRFQSPYQYNDPFDSQWNPLWQLDTAEALEYERWLIKRALLYPASWPTDADPQHQHSMAQERMRIEALPREAREQAIADFVEELIARPRMSDHYVGRSSEIRRRMRVCCFSETECSLLMWSHYAAQHRGVVLGFEASILERGLRRPLERVDYQEQFPEWFDPQKLQMSILFGLKWSWDFTNWERRWALTKHKEWAYEREWRFVTIAPATQPGEYQDVSFSQESLVEIIVGCRVEKAPAAEIQLLARRLRAGMRCSRMDTHKTRFELVKTNLK